MKKKKLKKERLSPFTIALLVVLILYVFTLFMTLSWAIITSFKYQSEFRLNVIGLPKKWAWNYGQAFKQFFIEVATGYGNKPIYVPQMFLNSVLYALGCAFFNTLVPCVTAYLCAKFPYKFSKIIYFVVIVTMILPVVGSMPSEIQVAKFLGLYDQIWGLCIMKANFLGMYFLVFYAMANSLPNAYAEAAKIDGAGNFRILTTIVFPLIKNTFFTVMLITFVAFWNDYQVPQIYLPSYPTIAFGVLYMSITTQEGMATIPMRMTSSMITLVPILIIFLIFQKRLLGNLTIGGIKG